MVDVRRWGGKCGKGVGGERESQRHVCSCVVVFLSTRACVSKGGAKNFLKTYLF